MNRPLLMRLAPEGLRLSLWSRIYRNRHHQWLPLYDAAPLQFAPSITMELVPGDLLSDRIAFSGIHEYALSKRLLQLGAQGGVLIDIGANLGYFPLLWAASNPLNRCFAIEASPRNVEVLRRNVARNKMSDRIEVIPFAAGAVPGKLHFDLGPEEQRGWGGLALESSMRSVEVEVVRVDEAIAIEGSIRVLKVDTEGADAWALMGCERFLRGGQVEEIWFEQNKPRCAQLGIAPEAAQQYLESVGYAATPHGDPRLDLVEWSAVRAN